MCGRFVLFSATEALCEAVSARLGEEVTALPGDWLRPSWNIAPTHRIAVVRNFRGRAVLGPAHWGFPAPWKPETVLFNARGETVFDKASFRGAEPALVVMNGWYEWAEKAPYFVHARGGDSSEDLMVVAGLVRSDTPIRGGAGSTALRGHETGPELHATIITSESAEPIDWLHARMPRVLTSGEASQWLQRFGDVPQDYRQNDGQPVLREIAAALPSAALRAALQVREADRAVGNVGINGPELIAYE